MHNIIYMAYAGALTTFNYAYLIRGSWEINFPGWVGEGGGGWVAGLSEIKAS